MVSLSVSSSVRACQFLDERMSPRSPLTAAYLTLAASFSRNLAGQFPFTDERDSSPSDAEAKINNIRSVYTQLKQLQMRYNIEELPDDAQEFLHALNRTRLFLNPLNLYEHEGAISPFRYKVDLIAGGKDIVQWSFATGDRHMISMRNKNQFGEWSLANPISIEMSWAKESQWEPIAYPDRPQPTISKDLKARFNYLGIWSMLRMLRAHTLVKSSEKYAGSTLRFQALIKSKDAKHIGQRQAEFLFKFTMFGEDGNEVLMPIFPSQAPCLSNKDDAF